MTSSKSDLEAKEGQIPNESNFLEFVSLLGSLSIRAGGASSQQGERLEPKEEAEPAEEWESQKEGLFFYLSSSTCYSVLMHHFIQLYANIISVTFYELQFLLFLFVHGPISYIRLHLYTNTILIKICYNNALILTIYSSSNDCGVLS